MDIFGTFCVIATSSVCITLMMGLLRRWCAVATSKSANVPDVLYPVEAWLSLEERQQLGLIRHLVRVGKISEDVPEDTVC